METLYFFVIFMPPLLFALSLHEFFHGYVAYRLGDPTAKLLGRLTLNPLRHIDPIGFIIFFIAKIGWAKPVPVNPLYFRNPELDMIKVSIAGPLSNFVSAILAGLVIRFINPLYIPSFLHPLYQMVNAFILISLMLAFFNIIPIPPLDGWRVLAYFIRNEELKYSLERYGFVFILILLILPYLMGINPLYLYLRFTVNTSYAFIMGKGVHFF